MGTQRPEMPFSRTVPQTLARFEILPNRNCNWALSLTIGHTASNGSAVAKPSPEHTYYGIAR